LKKNLNRVSKIFLLSKKLFLSKLTNSALQTKSVPVFITEDKNFTILRFHELLPYLGGNVCVPP